MTDDWRDLKIFRLEQDLEVATRRAEIPVHCAACGGIFPGTTDLHNGICDACHKLTHGPNYRLIAKLQDQDRLIFRLRGAAGSAARLLADVGTDDFVNPPTAEAMQSVAAELRRLLDD